MYNCIIIPKFRHFAQISVKLLSKVLKSSNIDLRGVCLVVKLNKINRKLLENHKKCEKFTKKCEKLTIFRYLKKGGVIMDMLDLSIACDNSVIARDIKVGRMAK